MKTQHLENTVSYECPGCYKHFNVKSNMKAHAKHCKKVQMGVEEERTSTKRKKERKLIVKTDETKIFTTLKEEEEDE